MKASEDCINLIKEFEGFAAEVYDDVGGQPTIGYGHLIRHGESFPKRISEAEATRILCRDLEQAEACIDGLVDIPLEQHQFDALASFIFNLGCTRFMSSTLLKRINAGDDNAADEFKKWCKVGQNQVAGLLRRRLAEEALFRGSA